MRHRHSLPFLLALVGFGAPALHAQVQDTARARTQRDTTICYVIRDGESAQILLQAGFTYTATLDGKDLKLEAKPVQASLREPVIQDISQPGTMDGMTRYTVRIEDSGLYGFRVVGMLTGRDVVMTLSGPQPGGTAPGKPARP